MGNTCEANEPCCSHPERADTQRSKMMESIGSTLNSKDLVTIKKEPISKSYVILSPPIGKGSFGSVYKIINRASGIMWAAKRIPISHNMEKQIQQILILKQLDHPNIIRIIDVFEQDLFLYVVMEICNGGELFDRIVAKQNLTEGMIKNYMHQLLSAISYCHMNRIMHRDLKPENIMIVSSKEENLKIIDFGASAFRRSGEMSSLKVGSVYYIAPEVIKKNYNEKCDIWSLGVIFYMMLSGTPPFNGKTDKAIFEKILIGKYSFPEKKWAHISPEAKDLVTKMLEYDPQKRISARQALNHPWCVGNRSNDQNLLTRNQLSSIRQFCTMNRFKESICTFITHNMTTAESLQKIRGQFKKMDKNNDGRISRKQFEYCYKEYLPQIEQQKLQFLFEKLDKNNSGYIDYSQFVSSSMSHQLLESREVIEKAFDMIDNDGDGFLSKQQILFALGGINQSLYQQMLQQCDINKDGLISKSQFMNAMLNISDANISDANIKGNTGVETRTSTDN